MGSWHEIEFLNLAKVQGGYAFKSDEYQVEGDLLVRIGNLQKGKISKENSVYINTSKKSFEDFKLQPDDILIGLTGDLGKLAKVSQDDLPALLNQRVGRFILSENTDIEFLFQLVTSKYFQEKLKLYFEGGAQANISPKQIESVKVFTPEDKPEQTRIAQILSKADTAIAQTEALIAKYQRIKTGLMQDLLTRGIDEQGNIRSKTTHRFVVKNGIEVPEEWEVKTFNQLLSENIIEDIQDGNHGEKHPKGSDFVKEGVPFIMASDISKNEIDFLGCKKITEEQYYSLRIGFAKPEDVLLSHKASIGFVAIVPEEVDKIMLTPQVTYYRIKNKEKLYFRYLSWFMRGEIFQNELSNLAKQSTRDYIGILMQRNLTLAYPNSKTEQLVISEKIETIDNHLKAENKKLSKAQSLKTGLMQDLLSGKVRVKIDEKTLVNL
jgi:type I restriction enzyme S subunit